MYEDVNDPTHFTRSNLALDSVGAESISSQLYSIQMGAFENENYGKKNDSSSKRIKKMIKQCSNLVSKTKKLSKFVNESLAKVDKVR